MAVFTSVSVESKKLNGVTNPIHKSRFQEFEKAVNDLFLKELNSNESIFVMVAPHVTKKIAMFLSGMTFRPAAIGVCGETASGKSTIVQDAICVINEFAGKRFENGSVTRINTDDYYHDRSKEVIKAGSFEEFVKNYDLDIPEAIELSLMKEHIQMLLNRQEVYLPKYDMSGTAKRFDNHALAKPSSVIVAEGIYTLVQDVSDIFDFKIYVDIDKSIQKKRFYERAQQRGLGTSADRIYENASQKAQIYVHPCIDSADIVLNGEISREKFKKFVNSLMNLVEANYNSFAV